MLENIPEKHIKYIKSTNYYKNASKLIEEANEISNVTVDPQLCYNGLITSFYSSIKGSLEAIDENPYKFLKWDSKVIRDYARYSIKES